MQTTAIREPTWTGPGQQPYGGPNRRKSTRVSLHWTVYLARDGSGPRWRTQTRNISPNGFYCVLGQLIEPGQKIECDIAVPVHNLRSPKEVAYLRCRAEVIRAENLASAGEFGLACRIEEYHIVRGQGTGSQLEQDLRNSRDGGTLRLAPAVAKA